MSNENKDTNKKDSDKPQAWEIAVYQQAHETRRKWESYIWSWGILVTALVSIMAGLLSVPIRTGENVLPVSTSLDLALLRKLTLFLLSMFLASIFLNVYRARCLMKQLESTIKEFHNRWHINDLPIVPLELDQCMPKQQTCLSSTKLSVFAHFLAFLLLTGLTLYEVFFR